MSIESQMSEYSKLNEAMKLLHQQIKEMKVKSNELSEVILGHMEQKNLDVINHNSDTSFKRKLKKNKSAVNKEHLQSSMTTLLKESAYKSCKNDDARAELSADYIMNARKETEKYVLVVKPIK
tara:strand:- start:1427 stop:1795 length:369 start_codon:yes stop_codon:yes gene_type:complete